MLWPSSSYSEELAIKGQQSTVGLFHRSTGLTGRKMLLPSERFCVEAKQTIMAAHLVPTASTKVQYILAPVATGVAPHSKRWCASSADLLPPVNGYIIGIS